MSAPDYLRNLYAYNEWANLRIVDAMARADQRTLAADAGAGMGSPLATLQHLIGAQTGWLAFWRGAPQPSRDASTLALPELRQRLDDSHDDLRRFLDALDTPDVARELADADDGQTSRWRLWNLLFHVVNHGTQHRAEIGLALSGAGGDGPGDLDYGHFCEERESADTGTLEMMRALYDYTFWATNQLLSAMEGMTDAEVLEPRPGMARGGIGMVLLHALLAQRGWLRIWSGYTIEWPAPGGTGSHLDNLREGFRRSHQAIAAFLGELSERSLAELRVIEPDQYNGWTRNRRRLWDAMLHVVNHTTQHRSEAAMALTRLGRSPGDLELDELMVVRRPTPERPGG